MLTRDLIQQENTSFSLFRSKTLSRAQTKVLVTQTQCIDPHQKKMENWFSKEYLIYFHFWLMQKWKWRMLRISLIEPHSWVAKFRVAVFVNTLWLKRSQLEPFWSVSNNQFTNICSESIWRDPQHCQYIDYANIPNIFSIFVGCGLRTPVDLIFCFWPLFWRMRHFRDRSCLNFFFFSKYCKFSDFDLTNYFVAQFMLADERI